MSSYDKMLYWYLPCLGLAALPVGALFYLFNGVFDPAKVQFSNDGPIGVMMSDYIRTGYPPGHANWNDLYWLGNSGETSPAMFTNTLYWIFLNPPVAITIFICLVIFLLLTLRNRYHESLRSQGCPIPVAPEPLPKDRHTACHILRCLAIVFIARFMWVHFATIHTPWDIKAVCSSAETITTLGFLFLGLPLWISVEVEHLEYLRGLSK